MQPQRPGRGRFWAALVTILLLSPGCRKAASPTALKQFAGVRLNVAVENGPARRLFEHHGQVWALSVGATLTCVSADRADADIVVFEPAELGQRAGTLKPIPASITSTGAWAGLAKLYRNKLLLWGDKAYAMPLLGDATFVVYRADLYAARQLDPPVTMAEFVAQAMTWRDAGKAGVLPPVVGIDRLDREFHTAAAAFAVQPLLEEQAKARLANDPSLLPRYAFHFDTATARTRIAEPGFVAALAWLQQLQPYRSGKSSWVDAFRSDDALLGLASVSDLVALRPQETPGRYGVAPLLTGPTGERIPYAGPGGRIGAVRDGSANSDAAFALLEHLSSPALSLEVIHDPDYGSAPYRGAHFTEQREGWANYGLGAAQTPRLRDALQAAIDPRIMNSPFRLRVIHQSEYRQTLLEGVRTALETNADPGSALAAIAARWPPLNLVEYQRSLNLVP